MKKLYTDACRITFTNDGIQKCVHTMDVYFVINGVNVEVVNKYTDHVIGTITLADYSSLIQRVEY